MWQLLKCCVCSFSHLVPNTKIENMAFFLGLLKVLMGGRKKRFFVFTCMTLYMKLTASVGFSPQRFGVRNVSTRRPNKFLQVPWAWYCCSTSGLVLWGGGTWKKPCFCIKLPKHKAYCYSCELARNCSYRNHITVAPWIYEVADIRTHFEKIHIFFIPYSLYRNNCQHN